MTVSKMEYARYCAVLNEKRGKDGPGFEWAYEYIEFEFWL